MDLFGYKRNYRFKGGNQNNENKLFWVLAIVLSAIFVAIAYYRGL
jgi:hypothetical protein